MHICGIICEYNPFHRGHEKQLRQVRQALGADAAIVCLMSGSFVQRGEPAIFEKRVRAQAAVLAGANLVLELPVTKALCSAEGFARGGVEIFTKLGIIDTLAFGCESGDGQAIFTAAQAMCEAEYDRRCARFWIPVQAIRRQGSGRWKRSDWMRRFWKNRTIFWRWNTARRFCRWKAGYSRWRFCARETTTRRKRTGQSVGDESSHKASFRRRSFALRAADGNGSLPQCAAVCAFFR